ncbi:MAG: hypothetical protein LUD82_07720 [Clostridiales bacterium]|nr:hypothetical protein [Clostridiales bacterium]
MDIYENNKLCSIGYALSFAKEFRLDTRDVPERLDVPTAKYAVQRYLKRNDKLLRKLVPESYALRLVSGKVRPKRLVCVSPAEKLELPGNWAELKLVVDARGIIVQRLRLTLDYPDQHARKRFTLPTISSWTPEDGGTGTV